MNTINHHNHNYSGTVPENLSDRQYSQDKLRDFRYLQSLPADIVSEIFGDAPRIISGGIVTQGSGAAINITLFKGITKFSVEIPNSFATIPPTKQSKDILGFVGFGAQTNLPMTGGQINDNLYANATLDSATTNYVKIRYKELDGDTRTKAKVVGSYVYEKTPSYEIRIEPVVNSAYEILIGKFTSGAGGAGYATVPGRSDSGVSISDKLTTNDIVHKNYNFRDKIEMVKDYTFNGGSETGSIKIMLPPNWVTFMPKFVLRVRSSTGASTYADVFVHISSQMHVTNRWNGSNVSSVEIYGRYGNTPIVKFGYTTIATVEYPTLLIGDVTDPWNTPQIQIESIHGSYVDLPSNWLDRDNYSISVDPTLTGYTNQFDIIPSVYGNDAKIAGNLEAAGTAKIDDWIELAVAGVGYGLMQIVNTGTIRIYSNAYLDAGVAKLRITGTSQIQVLAAGELSVFTYTGTAGDAITVTGSHIYLTQSDTRLGRQRASDGAAIHKLISAAGETNYNAYLQKASGANGILSLVNKGTGAIQLLTNDTVLGLSQDSSGQVKSNATTASTSTTTGSFVSAGGVGIGGALYVGDNINLVAGKAIINQWFADDSDTINDLAVTGLTSGTWLVFVSGVSIGNSGTDVILIREGGSTGTVKATLEDASTSSIKASNFAVISGTSFYIDIVNSAQRTMVTWTRIA